MLAPLLELPGVTWHSLQIGRTECPSNLVSHAAEIRDFGDTAALIARLDLVISVDTAVANLAGAMGVPVWIMVERDNDFRWGPGGDTTPWFPTARVFRQRTAGGWHRVIRGVRVALRSFMQARSVPDERGSV
jgi:hypothetical protein